jgi:hypothetical protein
MNAQHSFLSTILYAASLLTIDGSNALSEHAILNSASATNQSGPTGISMMTDDSLFQKVPLDTNQQTACSPADPGINWRGVVLRAPSRIIMPEKASQYSPFIIPICGLYLVDVASTFRHPGPKILVFTDDASGKTYRGALVKPDPEPTVAPPQLRPVNPNTKQAFGSYFNVNVTDYITLPMQAARYRVKIEYAGYESNELVIAIVKRP